MTVCAVKDCSNGSYGLERWTIPKEEICEFHGTRHDFCVCSPPHKLFAFPSAITDEDGRRNCWIKLVCLTFTHNDSDTVNELLK